jgi:hypothetical protein
MLMMRDIAVQHKKEMGEHAITKLQDWQDDPVLFTYCTHPKITQVRKIQHTTYRMRMTESTKERAKNGENDHVFEIHQSANLFQFSFIGLSTIFCVLMHVSSTFD